MMVIISQNKRPCRDWRMSPIGPCVLTFATRLMMPDGKILASLGSLVSPEKAVWASFEVFRPGPISWMLVSQGNESNYSVCCLAMPSLQVHTSSQTESWDKSFFIVPFWEIFNHSSKRRIQYILLPSLTGVETETDQDLATVLSH